MSNTTIFGFGFGEVNDKGKIIPIHMHHSMEVYGKVEVMLHTF
jgi:hypothetical protein